MKHYLSACLCFKDSANYLAEWLAFYHVLGVDHFFLYDNDSHDDYSAVVAPYIASGRATLTKYPGRGAQAAMYDHCLRTHGAKTRWMMFCDDDEFLYPVQDISLPKALQSYESYAGLAVCWMLYGTSGLLTRPAGLVVESYIWRARSPDRHVKCIIDPSRVLRSDCIGHRFACHPGELVVDEHHQPITDIFHPRPSGDHFRINHYLTKSRSEMFARRSRAQANTGEISPLSLQHWQELELGWNEVEDRSALRYGDRLRRHLGT